MGPFFLGKEQVFAQTIDFPLFWNDFSPEKIDKSCRYFTKTGKSARLIRTLSP